MLFRSGKIAPPVLRLRAPLIRSAPSIFRSATPALVLALSLSLVACATAGRKPTPAYEAESFSMDSPFQQHLEVSPEAACRFGQRALLSQGYGIEGSSAGSVQGTKFFQPDSGHQMRLDIALVCMPEDQGAVMYVRAVQTRYELKKSASNTGLSVAGIGSINLPWSEGNEALVKVGEETVSAPDFYKRFFDLLDSVMN